MPRPNQIITVEQITEVLEKIESAEGEAFSALRKFLKAELKRRTFAGNTGGRPVTVEDKKAANREYQRKWREKNK